MNSNDLFSFLDEGSAEDGNDDDMQAEFILQAAKHAPKRKAKSPSPAAPKTEDTVMHDLNNEPGPSVPKRPRISSPKPIVLDDFETEAKREIAASAGLTGSVDAGTRLELKHQVCGISNSRSSPHPCENNQVRHQVAVPPGYNYVPISKHVPPAKPDREYKFELDPFQKVSVHAIQRNESVLVSAHTSAGKTVVAEYAIAQCLNNKQRVIYTSPIKVLNHVHVSPHIIYFIYPVFLCHARL